jgi:hypothetical protein
MMATKLNVAECERLTQLPWVKHSSDRDVRNIGHQLRAALELLREAAAAMREQPECCLPKEVETVLIKLTEAGL